jgi:carbonic anhydrase
MQKLIEGLHEFQRSIFRPQREFFENLARGQTPETLFITCSDSRINPNLMTQTNPGELFIVRNAGNIIPSYQTIGGEAATIEYAVSVLKIRDVIVCGHSHCGAMQALLGPQKPHTLPAVTAWLQHAAKTRELVAANYSHLSEEKKISVATQENVLVQLEQLRSHPSVAEAIAHGELRLHGWMYKIETGEVFAYDPTVNQFVGLSQNRPSMMPLPELAKAI